MQIDDEFQANLFTKRFAKVKRRELEANDLHIPLVNILRLSMRHDVIWRHVPNGEWRGEDSARIGAKLKAMGTLAGSADLEFFYRNENGLQILFIELKGSNGQLNDAQKAFRRRAIDLGATYRHVRSINEALALLKEHGLLRIGVKVQ